MRQFNDFATGGLYPDLNILLNLPPSAEAWRRIQRDPNSRWDTNSRRTTRGRTPKEDPERRAETCLGGDSTGE